MRQRSTASPSIMGNLRELLTRTSACKRMSSAMGRTDIRRSDLHTDLWPRMLSGTHEFPCATNYPQITADQSQTLLHGRKTCVSDDAETQSDQTSSFTSMHLADAFTRSDSHCIQATHHWVHAFTGTRTHELMLMHLIEKYWSMFIFSQVLVFLQ